MRSPDEIIVELEPDQRFGRIARTIASAVCAVEEFSVDMLADVRLLVDDAFHALCAASVGPVTLRLQPVDGDVRLDMSAVARHDVLWPPTGHALLEAVAAVIAIESLFERTEERLRFAALLRDRAS